VTLLTAGGPKNPLFIWFTNDALGPSDGDRVLVEVARRLKACVRAGDTVARLGGFHFDFAKPLKNDPHPCLSPFGREVPGQLLG